MRHDEAGLVARMYAHDYAPGVDERDIVRWLQNCAQHPRAFCLVADDGQLSGFAIGALLEHPAQPGQVGWLEEVHAPDDALWSELAAEAVDRLWRLGARVVLCHVATDDPRGRLLEALGFDHDVNRYSLYERSTGAQ